MAKPELTAWRRLRRARDFPHGAPFGLWSTCAAIILALAAGCGFANDGTGRVRLPPPLARCSIVVQDDLGASLPEYGGPLTPGRVTGAECDVWRW